VEVDELAPGLWRWTGRIEGRGDVASLYLETNESVVLIDPIVPPEDRQRFLQALDRDVRRHGSPVHILLTSQVNEASVLELAKRYDADVCAPGIGRAPIAVDAVDAGRANHVMFWIAAQRTLYAGDCLYRAGDQLRLARDRDRDEVASALKAVLEAGVAHVVCSTGAVLSADAAGALRRSLGDG
jgi:glyoxylase-like metal-dependent hydrolase (beta-lactamase superfamily II)